MASGSTAQCGALGGAVSPDKWYPPVVDVRWPDEEAPTGADVERLVANAPDGLDVLFCHDAPWGVRGLRGASSPIPIEVKAKADDTRRLLRAALDDTAPRLAFHGHWHQTNRDALNDGATDVFGLAADGDPGCAAVVDIAALDARYTELR